MNRLGIYGFSKSKTAPNSETKNLKPMQEPPGLLQSGIVDLPVMKGGGNAGLLLLNRQRPITPAIPSSSQY